MAKNGKAEARPGRRVAIVAGLRTPFVKSGGQFRELTSLDLGKAVVNELIARSDLSRDEIDLHQRAWASVSCGGNDRDSCAVIAPH